jgi:hemin uptake protein HemP
MDNENSIKLVDSKSLFDDKRTVKIFHNGAVYTLRITKENKLILTK